jgi:GlpG protein
MPMVRALTVGADENLALFCAYLRQRRVPHRVFEERGAQVLEVGDATHAEQVQAEYTAWREGRLELQWLPSATRRKASWIGSAKRYPGVAILIGLAVAAFPVTFGLDRDVVGPFLPWLTIVPVGATQARFDAGALYAVLAAGQWWRLVTPIFIHFSVVHLLFNAAVVIEFGRRIERGAGSSFLLSLTLLIAIASNLAQFFVSHAALFGGLSGVAYGLFAYVAVRGRFDAAPDWRVNPSFSGVVVVTLVLMSSGITELFGLHLANAAHWVGLGLGGITALLWRPVRVAVDVA